MFAHEKLKVYRKALDFAAKTAVWVGQWDKRHALVDHLIRAAESVVSNLAEAARHQEGLGKLKIADYALVHLWSALDVWMSRESRGC